MGAEFQFLSDSALSIAIRLTELPIFEQPPPRIDIMLSGMRNAFLGISLVMHQDSMRGTRMATRGVLLIKAENTIARA